VIGMMAYRLYSSNMLCHINISEVCVDLESLNSSMRDIDFSRSVALNIKIVKILSNNNYEQVINEFCICV
jgi:hypothetical protein